MTMYSADHAKIQMLAAIVMALHLIDKLVLFGMVYAAVETWGAFPPAPLYFILATNALYNGVFWAYNPPMVSCILMSLSSLAIGVFWFLLLIQWV